MAELRTFRSSDGYEWHYRHYAASGQPRGRLVILHGIRSHGGWYTRSCEEFAKAGYEVYFLDRRGSGLNTTHRGDTPGFRRLLDDVAEFILELRRTQPNLPVHLAGISWGGKLAVGLPHRKPGLVESVTLLCPGLFAKVSPTFGQRISIIGTRFLYPGKQFPIPLNDANLFTSSPEWQKFIDEDQHGLRTATARFLFSSAAFDLYLKRAAKHRTVPTLLLLAQRDQIIDNAKTRAFVENFSATTKVIEYADAQHTLEFEDVSHPFIRDICDWLATVPEENATDR